MSSTPSILLGSVGTLSTAAVLVVQLRRLLGWHGDIGAAVNAAIALACVSIACAVPFLILFCFKAGRSRPACALLCVWLLLLAAVLYIEQGGTVHPAAVSPAVPASSP